MSKRPPRGTGAIAPLPGYEERIAARQNQEMRVADERAAELREQARRQAWSENNDAPRAQSRITLNSAFAGLGESSQTDADRFGSPTNITRSGGVATQRNIANNSQSLKIIAQKIIAIVKNCKNQSAFPESQEENMSGIYDKLQELSSASEFSTPSLQDLKSAIKGAGKTYRLTSNGIAERRENSAAFLIANMIRSLKKEALIEAPESDREILSDARSAAGILVMEEFERKVAESTPQNTQGHGGDDNEGGDYDIPQFMNDQATGHYASARASDNAADDSNYAIARHVLEGDGQTSRPSSGYFSNTTSAESGGEGRGGKRFVGANGQIYEAARTPAQGNQFYDSSGNMSTTQIGQPRRSGGVGHDYRTQDQARSELGRSGYDYRTSAEARSELGGVGHDYRDRNWTNENMNEGSIVNTYYETIDEGAALNAGATNRTQAGHDYRNHEQAQGFLGKNMSFSELNQLIDSRGKEFRLPPRTAINNGQTGHDPRQNQLQQWDVVGAIALYRTKAQAQRALGQVGLDPQNQLQQNRPTYANAHSVTPDDDRAANLARARQSLRTGLNHPGQVLAFSSGDEGVSDGNSRPSSRLNPDAGKSTTSTGNSVATMVAGAQDRIDQMTAARALKKARDTNPLDRTASQKELIKKANEAKKEGGAKR